MGYHLNPITGLATLIGNGYILLTGNVGVIAADLKASGKQRRKSPILVANTKRQAGGIQLLALVKNRLVRGVLNPQPVNLLVPSRVEDALFAVYGIQRTVNNGVVLVGGVHGNGGDTHTAAESIFANVHHVGRNVNRLQTGGVGKGIITDALQRVGQAYGCHVGLLRKSVIRHERSAVFKHNRCVHRHSALPVVEDVIQIGCAVRLVVIPRGIVKGVTADMNQRIGDTNIRQRLAIHEGSVHNIGYAVGDIHLCHSVAGEGVAVKIGHLFAQLQILQLAIGKGIFAQFHRRILERHRLQIRVHEGAFSHPIDIGRQRDAFQSGVAESKAANALETGTDEQRGQVLTIVEGIFAQRGQAVRQNHRRHRRIGERIPFNQLHALAQIQRENGRVTEGSRADVL